jgi:hypothetical protein
MNCNWNRRTSSAFIAERQVAVFARKLSDELSRRRFGIVDFAEISNFAVPAGVSRTDRLWALSANQEPWP